IDGGVLALLARPVVWGPVLLLIAAAVVYWIPAGWLPEHDGGAMTSTAASGAVAASASPAEFVAAPLAASAPEVVATAPASAPAPPRAGAAGAAPPRAAAGPRRRAAPRRRSVQGRARTGRPGAAHHGHGRDLDRGRRRQGPDRAVARAARRRAAGIRRRRTLQ